MKTENFRAAVKRRLRNEEELGWSRRSAKQILPVTWSKEWEDFMHSRMHSTDPHSICRERMVFVDARKLGPTLPYEGFETDAIYPKQSMHGTLLIFLHLVEFMVNVGKYTVHGC